MVLDASTLSAHHLSIFLGSLSSETLLKYEIDVICNKRGRVIIISLDNLLYNRPYKIELNVCTFSVYTS